MSASGQTKPGLLPAHTWDAFTTHDPAGMSNSMAFTRDVAEELAKDLLDNETKRRAGEPYVCHPRTVSSPQGLR